MSTEIETIHGYTLHGNRYLNVSNRCNLYCHFCPRMDNDWNVQGYELGLKKEPTAEELISAAGDIRQYKEIVFCGLGEPTIRLETIVEVGRTLKARGARIRLNTNGLGNQYHKRDITPDLKDVVDVLSISLNAQNAELFEKHCLPRKENSYQALLDFIRCAKQHIADISLTAVDGLEGVDIKACEQIANDLGVKFRGRMLDQVG
ncbi:MAG: TatD family nuclease-associated radical SAM protein [Gammaproteobacteria bacterium]|nr:TatD family nuclease-associated radical SAM protein [Gammaproteobacteria bacterium]